MPNFAKHDVAPDKPKTYKDPRQYLFFALALFFTKVALFSESYASGFFNIAAISEFIHQAFAVLACVVSCEAAHYHYKRNQFLDFEFYLRHRRFWLFIAVLPLLIVLAHFVGVHIYGYHILEYFDDLGQHSHGVSHYGFYGGSDIDDTDEFPFKLGYWHKTAMWSLFILTATWGPALHQHRMDNGMGGTLLLMADACALVYLFFYLTLPMVSPVLLLSGAASVTVITTVIMVVSASFLHVKQLSRDILYECAFWINLVSVLLIIGVLFYVIYVYIQMTDLFLT
ncbi:MAG: hypothetical protein ABL903_19880 [Methylococcales bacterium]